jgi:mono/diheme cytochrome c family protein
MIRASLRWPTVVLAALVLASPAVAQENLDKGKTPAQLFASDCAGCHKSPQGLAKSGGLFGLDSFLREHYTASRETATAIANYLKAMDSGPAAPGRASKRSAKGDEKTGKPEARKKPAAKPEEAKGVESKPDGPSAEPKPLGILAPEPKSGDVKTSTPAAGDVKPTEGAKKPE